MKKMSLSDLAIENQENNHRDYSLDALRVAATISVVLLHVSAKAWMREPIGSTPWVTATFYDSLVRWCVPAFVMISGCLLLDPDKPAHVKERLTKIAKLYVVWSGFYSLVDWSQTGDWKHALRHFAEGHYHLWYLYMIGGLYLALPLLKLLVKRKEYLQYFVLLSVLFNFLFPQMIKLISFYSLDLSQTFTLTIEKIGVNAVLGYSGYFVLGYLLYHYRISKKNRLIVYHLGVIGIIVTFFATKHYSEVTLELQEVFFSNHTINVLIPSIAVYVLFLRLRIPKEWGRCLKIMSNYCLGVYLIHPFVLDALASFKYHPFEQILVMTTMTLTISVMLTWILKRIPMIGDYTI